MTEWGVSEIFEPERLTITQWNEEDRPREKLMRLGGEALSDAELLAIIIGGGVVGKTAVDITKQILKDCDNNLAVLSKRTLEQLMSYHGIGEAKAISIMAVAELGRRRELAQMPERKKLDCSKAIYDELWPRMRDLDVEEAYLVLMNQSYKHIDTIRLSHGGITETAQPPQRQHPPQPRRRDADKTHSRCMPHHAHTLLRPHHSNRRRLLFIQR